MNTNKKVKIIGLILGVFLFALLMLGFSYAYFTWRSSNINISGTTECFTINNVKGSNITQTVNDKGVILFDESKIINNNTITIKEGMAITNVVAALNSECDVYGKILVNLNIKNINSAFTSSGNSTGAFKYVVASYDPSTYPSVTTTDLKDNTFSIIKSGSITSTTPITIVDEELTTTNKGYLVIFYIDGDLANNDVAGATFSATIEMIATQIEK